MVLMSFTESERGILLDLVRQSVEYGLRHSCALLPETARYSTVLQTPHASFVTLQKNGELRGCIGSLSAVRPLVEDVAYNAYAAAFRDPRFGPVQAEELPLLDWYISVLGTPIAIQFSSEQDLLSQLRPGIDGLTMQEGGRRGTFLPAVWESLPQPEDFLRQLKLKTGLPPDYWSDTLTVERYTAEMIKP